MTQQEDEGQEESYIRIKILGKGAFGEAVLYRKPENNLLVVWKEIDLTRVSSRSYVEVQNEIEILSLLNHANIVAYYNHYFHENMLYIEMEYANGGTLCHKIAAQTKFFPEETIRWYLFQILSAIFYIHDKNILHRDIKTLNIFLNRAALLKLGDFGMSKVMEENVMADTVVGTPYYMSPELIKGQKYDAKSDIWAVGCVLHEMLTLQKTFMASNTLKLANDILKGEITPIDASYTPDISEIVTMCFKLNPLERPSAAELLEHRVLKENEKMFAERTEEWKSVLSDSRPASRGQVSYVKDPIDSSSTVPVVTQSSTEVFYWGGGKTQPQILDGFIEGKSALSAALGDNHVAVVTIESELFTWLVAKGGDFQITGQLGHGDNALYKAPKLVHAFEGIKIKNVSCGCDFTCCITDSGVLYTFGSNYFGCLGLDNATERSLSPCKVPSFENRPLAKVLCGEYHVVALCSSGDVFSWGCGEFGRLGTGNEEDQFTPIKISIPGSVLISEISCGFDFTLFLTVTGKLLACGSNESNKLGMNQVLKGIAPEELSFDTPCVYSPSLVKPLAKTCLILPAAGKTHSAVINESGHLLMFGSNEFGQLGQGDSKPRSKVVQVKNALAGKRVTKVSCGDGFTIAVTADNQIYSWGLGENGRLGMDLSLQGKGIAFTALPRSIFGTLYKVKNVCSRGWNTVLIAEKVFSQKTLRPSSASGSRPTTATSNEKTNPTTTAKRIEFKEILTNDIHIVSLDGSDSETNPIEFGQQLSSIPTWLAQELEENELIPMTKEENIEVVVAVENTVASSYDNELNTSSEFNKHNTSKNVYLENVNDIQFDDLALTRDSTDNNLANVLESVSVNSHNLELERLRNENLTLRHLLNEKDTKINELESQLIHCKERKKSESEEIFDV